MIVTELQHEEAVQRLASDRASMESEESRLRQSGLTLSIIDRELEAARETHVQLQSDVVDYERAVAGDFPRTSGLRELGKMLDADITFTASAPGPRHQ